MRKRKCQHCGEYWRPEVDAPAFVRWCSVACRESLALAALEKVRKKQAAAAEKKRAQTRQAAKRRKREFYENDKTTRRKAATRWCHKYIHMRDHGKPCISCGKPFGSSAMDAGHYITAGSCTALRFDERNIHLQCHYDCNVQRSGNIVRYRQGLIDRYGEELVNFLEGPQPAVKTSVEWYRQIEEHFKQKCRELENENVQRSSGNS